MIPLDDVVLRDDLDPRLGDRDDDLIQQYADIFDALPPIEINQDNELIDGWHRVRAAERAERTEIAYVVVETADDDDLSDKMWAANLKHGVQYTRAQRKTYGLRLHAREVSTQDIAARAGVAVNTVLRWTKDLRDKQKQARDDAIQRLADKGKTQQEIAEELQIGQGTVSRIIQNQQMVKVDSEPESEAELEIEPLVEETAEEPEAADPELPEADETAAEEEVEVSEQDPQLETDETSAAEEEPVTLEPDPEPELEPPLPEQIPEHIFKTVRAVMGVFTETRPDDYVARLEASPSEWMTITDDSLSNELERELLTSAAAMCLWQEWMVWYQGENASAFTDNFGKIGPVFIRGQAGQWRIVSRLRSVLRRLWA